MMAEADPPSPPEDALLKELKQWQTWLVGSFDANGPLLAECIRGARERLELYAAEMSAAKAAGFYNAQDLWTSYAAAESRIAADAEASTRYREQLWQVYEAIYGHRYAESIDPFDTVTRAVPAIVKQRDELSTAIAAAEAQIAKLMAALAESCRYDRKERYDDGLGGCPELRAAEARAQRAEAVLRDIASANYAGPGYAIRGDRGEEADEFANRLQGMACVALGMGGNTLARPEPERK